MSIQETTTHALNELFPDRQTNEAAPDQQDERHAMKTDGPRQPGVIDQDYARKGFHLDVLVSVDQLISAAEIMFRLDYFIEAVTGVDWIKQDQLEVVYDFSRYDFELCRVAVRVVVPRTNPHVPTITGIYTGAAWHERETYEFFGIIFDGHPHLIPLLLPEDADFHPLLKDFKA